MPVELDRAHVRTGVGQRDGERTDAGSDLDDPLAGLQLGEADDPARGVLVGEEVLAERLRRPDPVAREELADLARASPVDAEGAHRVRARELRDLLRLDPTRPRQRRADRDHERGFVRLPAERLRREERRVGLDEDAVGRA